MWYSDSYAMVIYALIAAVVIIVPAYSSDRTIRTSVIYFFIFSGINFLSMITRFNNPLNAIWTGAVAFLLSAISSAFGRHIRSIKSRKSNNDFWQGFELNGLAEIDIRRIEQALGLKEGGIKVENVPARPSEHGDFFIRIGFAEHKKQNQII